MHQGWARGGFRATVVLMHASLALPRSCRAPHAVHPCTPADLVCTLRTRPPPHTPPTAHIPHHLTPPTAHAPPCPVPPVPLTAGVPCVSLPVRVEVVQHGETNARATGTQAALLAPDHVALRRWGGVREGGRRREGLVVDV